MGSKLFRVVYLYSLTKKEATLTEIELMALQKDPIVRIISVKGEGSK